jgi:hypothetical protein
MHKKSKRNTPTAKCRKCHKKVSKRKYSKHMLSHNVLTFRRSNGRRLDIMSVNQNESQEKALHVNQTNLRNAGSALQSSITEKYNDQAIGDFQADDDFYFNPLVEPELANNLSYVDKEIKEDFGGSSSSSCKGNNSTRDIIIEETAMQESLSDKSSEKSSRLFKTIGLGLGLGLGCRVSIPVVIN